MSIKSVIRSHVPNAWLNERNRRRIERRIKSAVSVLPDIAGRSERKRGIRFFADTVSGTGLSNGAAMLLDMLEASDVDVVHAELGQTGECSVPEDDRLINLFMAQPTVWNVVYGGLPKEIFDGHVNIGFWLWETPEIPKEWVPLCSWYDEIWTPSAFVTDAVRKVSERKVRTLRFGLNPENEKKISESDKAQIRERFGIPGDALVHIIMFDGRSGFERKNPEGAIKAYTAAYPEERENVWLVVKAKCADRKQMRLLKSLLKGYKNVVWIEELLSRRDTDALIASSDILISLHRAEGFGLPIAEAMQMGCVAVATDYSSTTEFVSEDAAVAVPYTQVRISHDVSVYRKGTLWAEPDIAAAAAAIRRLGDDPDYRRRLSERATTAIYEKLSFEDGARLIEEYEKDIDEKYRRTT
ncbi:MAG: glycosyltransferase [Lachnospiraceae bacterium]|nr:glycosyltransferase [Lachnospiraceae bacterium]